MAVCAVRVGRVRSGALDAVVGAGGGCVAWAWDTLELVVTLLTAGERTAGALELGHAHGWESRCGVVLGSVVMNLMDWHGSVHNMWLDSLAVDNRLDNMLDQSMHGR